MPQTKISNHTLLDYLTQEKITILDFAERAGLHKQTVRAALYGSDSLSLSSMLKICATLNKPVWKVFPDRVCEPQEEN